VSRHLIANSVHEHPDAVTIVGWDPEARTYFCQIKPPGRPFEAVAGAQPEEVPDANWLASILAEAGIDIPAMLLALLRLEQGTETFSDLADLDWRDGKPVPVGEG